MPSPFPGMDPWLEDPTVWPDFHDRLAEQVSASLNQSLPQPFYAQLGVREEVGIVGGSVSRRIIPDVSVQSPSRAQRIDCGGSVAVLDGPRAEVTESLEIETRDEPVSVSFIEIRDARSGHDVITLIEILSPSNKQAGDDRDRYLQKRSEILSSGTSLIEIDLLRDGSREVFGTLVHHRLRGFEERLEYVVLVQRAWRRQGGIRYQMFPVRLQDSLPVIAVPLRQDDPEVPLDLQYAFQQTYNRGPYRRGAVDYSAPPTPPLPEGLADWANAQLARNLPRQ